MLRRLVEYLLSAGVYISSLVLILAGLNEYSTGDVTGTVPMLVMLLYAGVAVASAHHLLVEFGDGILILEPQTQQSPNDSRQSSSTT